MTCANDCNTQADRNGQAPSYKRILQIYLKIDTTLASSMAVMRIDEIFTLKMLAVMTTVGCCNIYIYISVDRQIFSSYLVAWVDPLDNRSWLAWLVILEVKETAKRWR